MGPYKRKDSSLYWMSFTYKGTRYCKSTGTSDIRVARRIEKTLKGKIALGQWHPETLERKEEKEEFTFKQLVEKYLDWCEGRHNGDKIKRYIIQKHLSIFNDLAINEIGIERVEQLQTNLAKQKLKPSSINKVVNIFRHMMHKATDWEMCREETHRKLSKVKNLRGEGKRLRYLSIEECHKLLDACSDNLRPIVTIAIHTGMRKSEILGLKWDDVDFKHNRILLGRTKNGERREIPINHAVREALQGIIRRIDIPYVFFNSSTGTRYKRSLKKSFLSACKRANIKDFHFHDLRHTFASHLIMTGVDIYTVSKLLGHKSLSMTLRYAHLSPGHLDSAVNKLYDVLKCYDSATVKTDIAL